MFQEKTTLFNYLDIVAFPFAITLLYLVGRLVIRRQDRELQKYFRQAFWLRVIAVVLFSAILQFYYGSGDSLRYYISMLDMRKALDDGVIDLLQLFGMSKTEPNDVLFNYFFTDELTDNHYYMQTSSNFAVPKFAVVFSYLFFSSYLAISLVFSFFALLGCLQIYKVFADQFPNAKKQIAIACFFIPTVCFWSSGILKDSLTFGALGFLLNSTYNIFIRKRNFVSSIIWSAISISLLLVIKPYILLAFAPAMIILIFTHWSTAVKSKALKGIVFFLMLAFGLLAGILFYQNLTSAESLKSYRTETILQQIDRQRNVYESEALRDAGSNFSLGTEDVTGMFFLGFVAAYFRPFLWEVGSPIMALSAAESLLFLLLLLFVMYKVGVYRALKLIFSNPLILFCFIFSLLFGGAVGTSTGNFGTLVRYKIPGLPFFMLLNIALLARANVSLPAWTKRMFKIRN